MMVVSRIWPIFFLLSSIDGLEHINRGPAMQDNDDSYTDSLRLLLSEILQANRVERCLAIITDKTHHRMYEKSFFQANKSRNVELNLLLTVADSEDMLAPNCQTVRVLKQMRAYDCDLNFITLLNGVKMRRFLIFIEENRILNTRSKFVFLHDRRILTRDMVYIWSSIVSSIFVKRLDKNGGGTRFSLVTVPYPNVLSGVVVTKELAQWKKGKSFRQVNLFPDKVRNLNSVSLPTVVFRRIPMVQRDTESGIYHGLEVDIIKALGSAMNFKARFYESNDSDAESWGKLLANGSYTGLIGQMTKRSAQLAIGDLHLNELYSMVMDLSAPHTHECLTFLTPESSQDNTWKTLVLPFSGAMWAGVLLSLFMVGTVFYIMSWTHAMNLRRSTGSHQFSSSRFFSFFQRKSPAKTFDTTRFLDVKFRASLNRNYLPREKKDLFDDYSNCILLTYSMLLYVSLPRMPRNWPLRMLTGWYWIYCILLAVIYRASFTAILANPADRIAIDTLEELASSRIVATVWGNENKKFFDEAFDEVAQKVGSKLELVDDIYGVMELIAKGTYAYYDNTYFLRHLRILDTEEQRRKDHQELHIMRDCVIIMPIALGLQKNSPLKPQIDKYLRRLSEGGFTSKWLRDAVTDLPAEEKAPQEALMDLSKFWSSFVALAIGYALGLLALAAEMLHFRQIVQRHPLYDKYNTRMYYNFKRRFM